jgi:2-phospho-L-lactate guanylyltransferase
MTLWAIVPIKPLNQGKSRLSGVLTQEERLELNSHLLNHTLEILSSIPEIEQILVISRDQKALALARDYGARTIQENGNSQLNLALTRATFVAREYTTRGVLIFPVDLPLVTPDDVQNIIRRATDPPVVVVAPDRHRQGTNALLVYPAGMIEYGFGPGSFERHCERAIQAGARLEIVDFPSLELDIDLPEDLDLATTGLDAVYESF